MHINKIALIALIVSCFPVKAIGSDIAAAKVEKTILSTLSMQKTKLWLDKSRGYAFSGALLNGIQIKSVPDMPFPTFKCLSSKGQPVSIACSDPNIKVATEQIGANSLALRYSIYGTDIIITWSANSENILCQAEVVHEGELKIESLGHGHPFSLSLGSEDYGISPDGFLLRPDPNGAEISFDVMSLGNQARINVTGAKIGERILYLKPLTYSNSLRMRALKVNEKDALLTGISLYFRPANFQNPVTRLVHRELSWQFETTGDSNFDGEVDWVDAAIAYRDRYIKGSVDRNAFLRDSYRFFHNKPDGDTYKKLLETVKKIDFATGLFFVKGALKTTAEETSEFHPYQVERSSMGDKAPLDKEFRESGSRVGIYYGGEYLNLQSGDWPEELIKLGPDGAPMKNIAPHTAKDFYRGYITGKMKEHWNLVFDTARVGPGDPVYLDGYNSHSDHSYHPDYPTTPQKELETRRALSLWFKYDRRLIIAGEGLIEATVDIDDFALNQYGFHAGADQTYFWKSNFPKKYVPLLTVVYTGSVYCGDQWYEVRNGPPNWAAAITLCAGMWDWDSLHYPDHLYEKAARTFFNNNIFWTMIADYRIADIDQHGAEYVVRFKKGLDGAEPVLYSNPAKGWFCIEKNGVRYDGFTPFSTKGVMAILKQGDFDITLPVKDELEVLPSQPHREKLDVKIIKTSDGYMRVTGNFSKFPWRLPFLTGEGPTEKVSLIDAEPVLLLRKKIIAK